MTGIRVKKSHRKLLGLGHYLAHRRMVVFWNVAAIALIGPWILKGCDVISAGSVIRENCTVSSVYDGDTLRAECDGEKLKVRLYCIDTPEMAQRPWGTESRDYLRSLLPQGSQIQLVIRDKDRYGRQVAEVMQGKVNQNLAMVQSGHAAVYRKYCPESYSDYYLAEDVARNNKAVIWEKPGLHQSPWEWRHRDR